MSLLEKSCNDRLQNLIQNSIFIIRKIATHMKKWIVPVIIAASTLGACNKDKDNDNRIESQLAGSWRGSSRTFEEWDGANLIGSKQTLYGDTLYTRETYGKDSSYSYTLFNVRADSIYKTEELRGKFKVWNSYIIHTVSDVHNPSLTAITDTVSFILEGKRLTIRSEAAGMPYKNITTSEFMKED